jgi:signal transduction histidine kinase
LGPDLRVARALHPDDRSLLAGAVDAAMAGDGTYECEYRAIRPDGSTVWITERGRVLRAETGAVEKVVGVSRDVSAQRRAELERERLLVSERTARDEAERQSRIKDEFLATLSHELRTPMNAILGWLSLLDKREVVRDADHAVAVIRRNAEVQAKLIDDLLEMTQLTSGTARLEIGEVDLAGAVENAVEALEPAARAKTVHLSAKIDAPAPRMAADGRRIQQVLYNLLHNAIKFTGAGGRVDVMVTHADGEVRITVKDTGQGIPRDFLPYVFDRFRQADSSSSRATYGLGLGLSIARHLVELHGGTIHASSAGEGHGSTFIVRVPAAGVAAACAPSEAADAPADRAVQ